MKRRAFIRTSLAATAAVAVSAPAGAAERSGSSVYELRTYAVKPGKRPVLDAYLGEALVPALKRFGAGPVGVFVEQAKDAVAAPVTVLTVFPSADAAVGVSARLAADEGYLNSAKEYLAAHAAEPVYTRIESSVLTPIVGMPVLEKPDTSKPRLLNLRVYESHNERAAAKKVEMFNRAELAIFRRVGLTPVFFGSTVVGPGMPNLTYMLTFPDDAGREAAWNRFRADAEWLKLKAMPEYADKEIVSKITNKLLVPTAYSEI